MRYWLMKSEPDLYSIQDLQRDRQTIWDGVRNYQARNFLREMQVGDKVFFYHSNTNPLGIAGLMRVIKTQIDDPTQFDPGSKYYDPKSTKENPRWQTVQVEYESEFSQLISLETLRQFDPAEFWLIRPGNRLSVMPVAAAIAGKILKLERQTE